MGTRHLLFDWDLNFGISQIPKLAGADCGVMQTRSHSPERASALDFKDTTAL